MQVRLDYGEEGLAVDLPDSVTVIRPEQRPALSDPHRALVDALRNPISGTARPLRAIARPQDRVAISVCDMTRPQPRREMLAAILAELDDAGSGGNVTVLIATGTHRGNTQDELQLMLGDEVLSRCAVRNHDSRDESQLVTVGVLGDGTDVRVNRHWVEADVRITTGFVEPHFFAGFSGGPKMVAPGLAGLDTVLSLHNAPRIASAKATWGAVEGNPVHDAIREAAALAPPHVACDVLLNTEKHITHCFVGDLLPMHAAAVDTARRVAMQRVTRSYPIVITTNSGFPLDQNLYQVVKGMSAAAEIVSPGGTIICAAECRDGMPANSAYAGLLQSAPDISAAAQAILDRAETVPDQWQVQVQGRVQAKARVLLYSDGLSDDETRAAHLEPIDDISGFVNAECERDPELRVAVLPSGPQTIAYVG